MKPERLAKKKQIENDIIESILNEQKILAKGDVEKETLLRILAIGEEILEEIKSLREDTKLREVEKVLTEEDKETPISKQSWIKRILH